MENLRDVVLDTMQGYTGRGLNAHSYFTSDELNQFYTVITVAKSKDKRINHISLLVRLQGDVVIIEEDINNKPLVDALVQNGILREQIILAYAGEIIPEAG